MAQAPDSHTWQNYAWQLKFAWWPQRCNASQKWIWLEFAYCGQLHFVAYDGSIQVAGTQWHQKLEHLMWRLKL
jgi:hypothetical protein